MNYLFAVIIFYGCINLEKSTEYWTLQHSETRKSIRLL